MIEKFKKFPLSLKLAISFLTILYVFAFIGSPYFMLFVSTIILGIASIMRIIKFALEGK